jgi:hypothetical protein
MDAKTRRFVDGVLDAAEDYDSEAVDRAYQRATTEAAKHRERERRHREDAEAAELLARRLAGIRQLKSADTSDPKHDGNTSARARATPERGNQAKLVRGAIDTQPAGRKVAPKQIFDALIARGAAVDLNNVQLEMGRLVKRGKLIRLRHGKYQIPAGGD